MLRIRTQHLIIMSIMFIGACSEEGLDEFVEMEMTPSSPIIIYTDTTIQNGDTLETVTAPWFLAGFEIENFHSDYTLVVPSLRLEYTGYYRGSILQGESIIDATTFCSTFEDPDRIIYAIVAPGKVFYGDNNCNALNAGTLDEESVYLHDLPIPDNYNGERITYDIKVVLNGYFEDNDGFSRGNVEIIRYYSSQ